MHRIEPELTANARYLRTHATEAERILWLRLRQYRPRFTRQLVVERYILDLACRAAKLGVELDGSQHLDAVDYDAERTRVLEALGWTIIRYWNGDVVANPDGVASDILAQAAACLGGTHPQPLPGREGRIRMPRYD